MNDQDSVARGETARIIGNAIRDIDRWADGEGGHVLQSTRDHLAALHRALAVPEGAVQQHKHTDECLTYAAETGFAHCIAACRDSRAERL